MRPESSPKIKSAELALLMSGQIRKFNWPKERGQAYIRQTHLRAFPAILRA